MRWEGLTSPDFAKAVRETGVCILPMGVLEKHGEQLPLGTDYLIAHEIALQAARIEPAVVFPPFYFGQINEARCFPGTVSTPPIMLIELVQAVLDEIGRNGFRKIILFNWHGGNPHLIGYLVGMQNWEEKNYVLYVPHRLETPERQEKHLKLLESGSGGHGGEYETSIMMALEPEMVKMEDVAQEPAPGLGRQDHLKGIGTATSWYAKYPEHYSGDARPSTAEKGKIFVQSVVDTLVEYIRAVKKDEAAPMLKDEFFKRTREL